MPRRPSFTARALLLLVAVVVVVGWCRSHVIHDRFDRESWSTRAGVARHGRLTVLSADGCFYVQQQMRRVDLPPPAPEREGIAVTQHRRWTRRSPGSPAASFRSGLASEEFLPRPLLGAGFRFVYAEGPTVHPAFIKSRRG